MTFWILAHLCNEKSESNEVFTLTIADIALVADGAVATIDIRVRGEEVWSYFDGLKLPLAVGVTLTIRDRQTTIDPKISYSISRNDDNY